MNKRALTVALIYSAAVILFKLIILLGGYTLTHFGFYYSNITAVLFIVPFLLFTVQQVRDKERGGIISGREAVRMALTVVAVSALVISAYNYVEFVWKYKDIAKEYYHSQQYLDILTVQQAKHPDKFKPADFPRIIDEQIASLSAFRATTGRLTPLIFIGLSGAFLAAVFMKRSAPKA